MNWTAAMKESEARASLAEKLKKQRKKHHISKTKLAKQLHVPVSTITSIENPEDSSINKSNLHGLANRYAKFVKLDTKNISEELEVLKPLPQSKTKSKDKTSNDKGIFIASKATLILAASVILLIILSYAVWQAWQLAAAPRLDIQSPSLDLVTNDPAVVVEGQSSPDASVLVNGDSVSLDANGNFKITYYVQPGENTLQVQALNAFGNEAIETRRIIYQPLD